MRKSPRKQGAGSGEQGERKSALLRAPSSKLPAPGHYLLRLFMAGRARVDDYARWQRLAERRGDQPNAW